MSDLVFLRGYMVTAALLLAVGLWQGLRGLALGSGIGLALVTVFCYPLWRTGKWR